MIDQAFTNDVNARLAVFLQQNQFKSLTQQELQYLGLGLTQQEIDQRGITTLFWINDKLILELY